MKTNLFTGGENGYHTYRIPALLVSQTGTLLAFCEGRRNNSRDHGDIDILLKRSEDGGKTWSQQQVVYGEPGDITIGNPCPVVDGATGVIWLPFCRDNRDVLITHSADDGRTWAEPRDITANAKDPAWTWYATGPGVGIQLQGQAYRNRLVIPCDHRAPDAYNNGSHAIYSDDGGQSWTRGGVIQPGANECQVIEREDGALLMNIRMQTHSQNCRATALSEDGGQSWTGPSHTPGLPDPTCQASFIRHTRADRGRSRLLFSNPAPSVPPSEIKGNRTSLTVRLSYDEGRTWPESRLLHDGPSAYSCLAALPGGDIACLYEGGVENRYAHLIFARFALDWLTGGRDSVHPK